MSSSANVRHQAGLPPRYHIKIQESFATATAARFGSAARWRSTILFTPPVWLREQDYTGSFGITGLDDSNVLSGAFSEPLLGFDAAHSGSDNENQLQFSNFGNEGGWSFTSDISGLASNLNEDDQQIYFLGFFNASTLGITDGTYSSFTANGTGNFSSTGPAMATPEPSTYAMMLIGFVGLGYAGLRKARATAASV
jgi:PEP-CTERM motif